MGGLTSFPRKPVEGFKMQSWKRVLVLGLTSVFSIGACAPPVVNFSLLANWTRVPGGPHFGGTAGNFAGDAHVWEESPGNYRMVYTTENVALDAGIGMATSTDLLTWTPITSPQYGNELVLKAGADPTKVVLETAFYYKTPAGQHQIYYIACTDEGVYDMQIFRATASNINGPYSNESTPVIAFGASGTFDDAAMTSPSIVEYNGELYMEYIGWDDSPKGVSFNVLTGTAKAPLDGSVWTKTGSIPWEQAFGVESHTEKGPDGWYYRAGVVDGDILGIGWSTHPHGPWTSHDQILAPGGAGVGEVDQITSPSLYFHVPTNTLYMYYAAVDTGGFPWMTSIATAPYQ